jgi:hypothetical protein
VIPAVGGDFNHDGEARRKLTKAHLEKIMKQEEITMRPVRNPNANPQAKTVTGGRQTGIILALSFFLMLVSSAGAQVTLLYNFGTHSGDPAHPNNPGAIVQGRDGNLYSTSNDGGTDNAGTVFKVTPAGKSAYCTVLME